MNNKVFLQQVLDLLFSILLMIAARLLPDPDKNDFHRVMLLFLVIVLIMALLFAILHVPGPVIVAGAEACTAGNTCSLRAIMAW